MCCHACKTPPRGYPLPNIKDIRAACRNAARKLEPAYLGPLSLSQALSHLRHHEGCDARVMLAYQQAAEVAS